MDDLVRQKVQPDFWQSYPGLSCVGTQIHFTTCITLKNDKWTGPARIVPISLRRNETVDGTGRLFSRMQLWPSDKSDTQLERFASLDVFFSFFYVFLVRHTTTSFPTALNYLQNRPPTTLWLGTTQSLFPMNEHQIHPQFSPFTVLRLAILNHRLTAVDRFRFRICSRDGFQS